MTAASTHYDRLLARHYTWMFGVPFADKVLEQKALLQEAGVSAPHVAIDLGCGSGFQSIALADLGAQQIHALDTSRTLLSELQTHTQGRPITAHEADLMDFDRVGPAHADTIVCMGDTVTHLARRDDVTTLMAKTAAALSPGGRFVLSYRDLSVIPQGVDRFIPLRSSDDTIMTCFLEDSGSSVLVHDLVHVRNENGWDLHKSAYSKLKLPLAFMTSAIADAGMTLDFEINRRGMIVLAASK
jgi:predicted TPR repeat methyltransferase